ncbi:MAG: DUF1926 domain-containing protein [Chitinispirillia bacterium]|nr:DUF1926 domain-containing protein [Chitinispirillia bacterium]
MRRDQIILLLQPYKNGLMPKKDLIDSVNQLARLLLSLCEKYPRLRFNVALPGYILECIDPLVISSMRAMVARGSLEWLCTGYTEPFLSFSPLWLTSENIALGASVFTDLTGEPPEGYVPPFSNWEPSHIDMFNGAGLKYAVIAAELLPKKDTTPYGYWMTEYTGTSMALFPTQTYHRYNAPESIVSWVKENTASDTPDNAPQMLILKYLYSLLPENAELQKKWFEQTSAEVEKHILELQPLRFKDVIGNVPPLGLHYFPPSLVPSHNEPATPYFLNHMHCYDQIGVLQRKMMDVSDSVRELKDSKLAAKLRRLLFFAQDINRFLPAQHSGFCKVSDRLWTYGKLIDVERELYELRDTQNGVIRLADFLRNGYKSVIMSNKALKMCLDHKNGAHVYELDYRERSYNAFAAYNPAVRTRPNVIVPRESKLGFCDKIFMPGQLNAEDYARGLIKDCANFAESAFEYTFKNTPTGVKVILNCTSGFADGGRTYPMSMDKVFGLEKDSATLSYSYKLGNTSLTNYSFIFGTEIPLALPDSSDGEGARIIGGKTKQTVSGKETIIINDITEWAVEDEEAGVRMEFVTQKKVDVWLLGGDTLLITCPVEIEANTAVSLTGRISFKKIKARRNNDDSL